MKRIELNSAIVLRHLINWILLTLLIKFFFNHDFNDLVFFIVNIIEILLYATCYYTIAMYVAPFNENKKTTFKILLALLFLIYLLLYYIIDKTSAYLFQEDGEIINKKWLIFSSLYYVMICMLAISFYKNQLLIQTIKTENEKTMASLQHELSFFRFQFNAKISQSFFNFCKQLFNANSDEAKSIQMYQDMLEQTNNTEASEAIALEDEIQYIQNYISLQYIIGKKIQVKWGINGDIANASILPRILIGFVENAFKYSPADNSEETIDISIHKINQLIHFKISNPKKKIIAANTSSTKIGQENIRQHLDLFYPNSYKLEVIEDENTYTCTLELQLK
jgi:two-component system, LytTR family, sensor kinase